MTNSRTPRSRKIGCLAVVFLVIGVPLSAQDMRPLSSALAKSITASGRKTVAVIDFTDLQGNVTELGRFLAEEFSIDLLADAKGFEVIDRTHLKSILQEHKLATTGLIDPQTARKLGQVAGVDTLVTGTIIPLGDSVKLTAKALDTNTAKMLGASTADIPRTRAIEELLQRGIGGAPVEGSGRGTPPLIAERKTAQKLYAGDFVIELQSCNMSGMRVICRLLITNAGAGARRATLGATVGGGGSGVFHLHAEWGQVSSRMFDNAGNEYHATVVRLGNRENRGGFVENTLVEGVPMSALLVFENLAPETSEITALIVGCWDGRQDHTLKFGNVRLTR